DLADARTLPVTQRDELDACVCDCGRSSEIPSFIADDNVLRPPIQSVAANRKLCGTELVARGVEGGRRRNSLPVDGQRQHCSDRKARELQPVASSSVAHFEEIGRRDFTVEPGLNILTCRRNKTGKQRVVGCRKSGLTGL